MQLTLSPVGTDTPFRLSTAPADVFVHPGWQQARMAALALLGRGESAALLGATGTGKTMLLQDLARTLRGRGRSVRIVERGDALETSSRSDILLVDEAGSLDRNALAALCASGVPFLLAALPDFEDRLASLPGEITPIFLDPLCPQDVARFVAGRLAATGRPRDLIEPDAVLALARHSGGRLRLVNVLAGAAVFLAGLEHAPHVGRQHVDEAAAMRGVDADETPAEPVAARPAQAVVAPPPTEVVPPLQAVGPARRRAGPVILAAGIALLLAAGLVVSQRDPRPGPEPVTAVVPAAESPPPQQPLPQQPSPQAAPAQEAAQAAPATPEPRRLAADAPLSFSGVVNNETMRQSGRLSLVVRRRPGSTDAVTTRFHASAGLIGDGELEGRLTEDGRLSASGQLMMGQNAFMCDLSGTVSGGRLAGTANFRRSGGGTSAHSSFVLTRP